MSRQTSFAELEYASKKRRTRRELFLAEMEAVVPWAELLAEVESHYPRAGRRGRPPVGLSSMLRIYFLQQWFALSDRQMEGALYDTESMRRFAGFSSVTAALPDETTILNFRHLLIHIGANVDSGAAHSVSVTAANRVDIAEPPNLLRPDDQAVFGDAGYASDQYKRGARAAGICWRVQDKAKPKGSLGAEL